MGDAFRRELLCFLYVRRGFDGDTPLGALASADGLLVPTCCRSQGIPTT